ncbi:hypothetical protein SAMN04488003_105122 [Loktanella fryxellensis]|uniref:Uncharacterized protein n=1 Tax=Loktanella fryxellensis TaxID=245187 RepID=A0A1H8BP87_9RHOB|nr:hypothetical protein [Loktanella fryxellensis]SEM84711.1 hypothetical protein SAMN04488003_105122 [Loktanella fryxellensis]
MNPMKMCEALCAAGLGTTALPAVAAGSQPDTRVIARTIRVSC